MSVLQFVAQTLEDEWMTDVTERTVSVPKPEIVVQSESSNERLEYEDVIKVSDGGVQTIEPGGLGHNTERVETLVTLDIRSTDNNRPDVVGAIGSPGRVRMFGYRDEYSMESERYGGLVGEVRRIAAGLRKGEAEFDLVATPEVNDLTTQVGMNKYRVEVLLRFTQLSADVEPGY